MEAGNYLWATHYIKNPITSIVEVGSRDGLDAVSLAKEFNCSVLSFECDPNQYEISKANVTASRVPNIQVLDYALSDIDGELSFWQVDTEIYDNPGTGSLYEINFTNRKDGDVDSGREPIQHEIKVRSARFDSLGNPAPDLLVMDVQGAEVRVLNGFGTLLKDCKFVICEAERVPSYLGGNSFSELHRFMKKRGFTLRATTIGNGGRIHRWMNFWRTNLSITIHEKTFNPLNIYQGCFDVLYENTQFHSGTESPNFRSQ